MDFEGKITILRKNVKPYFKETRCYISIILSAYPIFIIRNYDKKGQNLRADCPWSTLVPLFENGANAAPISPQALSAVHTLMLAVVALKQQAIRL